MQRKIGTRKRLTTYSLIIVASLCTLTPIVRADSSQLDESWTEGLPQSEIKSLKPFDKQIELNAAKGYSARGMIASMMLETHKADKEVFAKLGALALSDLTKAISLNPKDVSSRLNRASVYAKLGQPDKARSEYNDIIAMGLSSKDYHGRSPNAAAFLNRGMLSLTANKHFEAAQDFTQSIKNDPYDPFAYTTRALAESRYDATTDAINDLSSAIELDPRDREAYSRRADLYQKMGSGSKAEADRKTMAGLEYLQSTEFYNFQVEQNPGNVGARFLLADKLMNSGEFGRAVSDLSEVLKTHPRSVEALYMRGKCFFELKKYELAILDFDRAIELDPLGARAQHLHMANGAGALYEARAKTYSQLKQYKKTIADYTKLLQLIPTDSGALSDRSTAYFIVGDFVNSLRDDTAAIKISPYVWMYYRDRAYSYESLGQLANAITDCNTAIDIIKDDDKSYPNKSTNLYLSRVYKFRSKLLAAQGKQAESKNDLELSTKLSHM